ncbi:MAG: WbqC family protein [Rhodospirillales bacterium]|nr:WbqC family protein [Rhodospirillales bacterium]
MTVVITQPTYLPWLGYFEQMASADTFVFLDTVQFTRRTWQSRNQIKGLNGQPLWLTVPVARHDQQTAIRDIRICPAQPKWRYKHLKSIETSLKNAPYFDRFFPEIEAWIEADYEYLADFCIAGILMFAGFLDLNPRFHRASELNIVGKRSDLLLAILLKLDARHYYTSLGAKVYLEGDRKIFDAAGIEIRYQTWEHPVYPQQGSTFVSHLSVIDALMNIGPAAVRRLITDTGTNTTAQRADAARAEPSRYQPLTLELT